jgi:hypothetical protein
LDIVSDYILHYNYLPMPSNDPTPVIFSQDSKGPLILTVGILTHTLLHAFQMGSLQYFSQKNITADKHVASIIWGLYGPCIQNWYIIDIAHIDALTFKNFMNEIHTNWLTNEWEGIIEQSILNATQGDKPLWAWV